MSTATVQRDLTVDEIIIQVKESQINKALEDSGLEATKENVAKVIEAGVIRQLEKNIVRFISDDLEEQLLYYGQYGFNVK